MLNLGMSELLLFAIIAVVVLGPDKLPTAMRSVLKWYRQIKMLMSKNRPVAVKKAKDSTVEFLNRQF